MTTAKGLQSFVFSENEAWMAYLASFAVQAILVCFSLTFCHIYSAIRSITTLSDRGKTLATGALTLFLAASFVVSSSFSFSYIANNAYILLGANDSEIIVERYLTQRITDLGAENNRVGSLLYDRIVDKNQTLTTTIDGFIDGENENLKTLVTDFSLSAYNSQLNGKRSDFGLTDEIVDGWKREYPSRVADINGLVLQFESYANDLKQYCDNYSTIQSNFNRDKISDKNDWSFTESVIQNAINSLTSLSKNLGSLQTQCKDIKIYVIDVDITPYKGDLIYEVEKLQNHVSDQIDYLNHLKERVEFAANGYSESGAGASIVDQIQKIQKEIYMLNTMDVANNTQASQQKVSSIIEQLSTILMTRSNDDILNSNSVADILQLEELVSEYGTYIDLKHDIDRYIDQNLSKTYKIIRKSESEVSDEPTNETWSDNGSVTDVTYEEWVSCRNRDFLKFFGLLKNLPDMSNLTESTSITESTSTADITSAENYSDKPDHSGSEFVSADVLYEANVLRRDLLGQKTSFERAFNYFKYDFWAMAFFSAFIAAFFDLGAFLTGCFLYVMRHFAHKNQSRTQNKNAGNPKHTHKSG